MATLTLDDVDMSGASHECTPPLDHADDTSDDGSVLSISPPRATPGVTYRPFINSQARKRAIAESKAQKAPFNTISEIDEEIAEVKSRFIAMAEGSNNAESNITTNDNKLSGSTDLKSLVYAAKQKALTDNHPKKAHRVEELYQRSLHDGRLSNLLKKELLAKTTSEEHAEPQTYVNGTKLARDTASVATETYTSNRERDIAAVERLKAQIMESQPGTFSPTPITRTQIEQVYKFCESELWPRYCRLPPGRDNTDDFEAMYGFKVNSHGESVPNRPAPDLWLYNAWVPTIALLEHVEPRRHDLILMTMAEPGYKGQDVHALLAKEVRRALHRGPFKGSERGLLGVLLECVGIERKGTYWKGQHSTGIKQM